MVSEKRKAEMKNILIRLDKNLKENIKIKSELDELQIKIGESGCKELSRTDEFGSLLTSIEKSFEELGI